MQTSIVPGSLAAIAQRDNLSLAESFLSVDGILVVDMSGSMAAKDAPGGKPRFEAACEELRRLQAEMPGRVAVIAFSGVPEFCPGGVPPFLGGGTDMAAALRMVLPADGLARIVLISDGDPDSPSETLAIARQFKSRIDTIYIGPERGSSGREFLARLAAATGGQSLATAAPAMFGAAAQQLLLSSGRA